LVLKMKKNSKKLYWIIAIVLLVAAAVTFFSLRANNAKKAASANLQTVKVTRGDLTAIVGATGTVHARQNAVLAWQTAGRVEEIKVAIGDLVNAEDVLASLQDSSLPQSILLARSDLVAAERELENLKNSSLATAQAELNLANAKDAYHDAVYYGLKENAVRATDKNKMDEAKAALVLAQDRLDKAQDFYDRFANEPDDSIAKANALSNLAAARDNLRIAENNLSIFTDPPAVIDVEISQAKIAVAKAQLDDAQREWERLKDGPDPLDIRASEARIEAIKATIGLAQLTAPFNGTITDVANLVGDQVNTGTSAFRIDDLSQLLVDVEVPEVDINRIKVDQPVQLTFDAINAAEYEGRVVSVARVGTEAGGVVNFKVSVELLNPDEQVLPGMTAAVNIIVNQLTDVLTVPNRAVRLVDNKRVVYVLRNNTPTAVEVTIGASSDTVSEILSGDLKVGDLVILNPPTDFSNFRGSGMPF